jgi:PIN domain nuclease of toxin-antitoxin system
MNYLLDTNVVLQAVASPERLNKTAIAILGDVNSVLYFSAVSVWEIAIKAGIGKLRLPESPAKFVAKSTQALNLLPLPITQVHALGVFKLPKHHADPFDRMLIAQAEAENLALLTADRVFQNYDLKIIDCGK